MNSTLPQDLALMTGSVDAPVPFIGHPGLYLALAGLCLLAALRYLKRALEPIGAIVDAAAAAAVAAFALTVALILVLATAVSP